MLHAFLLFLQTRALLLASHRQVKFLALPDKQQSSPRYIEGGGINIAGSDAALSTHLGESLEGFLQIYATDKSRMDFFYIDEFETDGVVSSLEKNLTSPNDFIIISSVMVHNTLNNLIFILPYQTTSVASMSNELIPTHLITDNKNSDSNKTTTPMEAISSKLRSIIHLIKKTPEIFPHFSALCHHLIMSETSLDMDQLEDSGPAQYIGHLQFLQKLHHDIVCRMAHQLQQKPDDWAMLNPVTLGLWEPDSIDFSEGRAIAKVILGRAGPYFSQAVSAWLNYFKGFRLDSFLLEDALLLAFFFLYLGIYFIFLVRGDSSFGVPCGNEKPVDFSTYSFLFGVDDDDDDDDDAFPLGADGDDDAFPLSAVVYDYDEYPTFAAAADGVGDDNNDSLCYSLDSDVSGDDDDELSVFSLDSVASGDIDNDSALPVIESSCSAVTLPAVEASCSAPQLRRSPRIAKMKHVCYKKFF